MTLGRALGVSSGISMSTVSRICEQLDEEVTAFRDRALDHIELPYVFVDATYLKGRKDHRVVSRAVVVATGVVADGTVKSLTSTWATPKTRCISRMSRSNGAHPHHQPNPNPQGGNQHQLPAAG